LPRDVHIREGLEGFIYFTEKFSVLWPELNKLAQVSDPRLARWVRVARLLGDVAPIGLAGTLSEAVCQEHPPTCLQQAPSRSSAAAL
jgi:hypothetical protein